MTRALLALLVAGLASLATTAHAHGRSQSFSTWDVRGGDVTALIQVSAVEATRLVAGAETAAGAPDLGALLRDHLAATVSVTRDGAPCPASGAARSLTARTGSLRVELHFACAAHGVLRIRNGAFFDLASSHVHIARVGMEDEPQVELLFTDAQREQKLPEPDTRAASGHGGASFGGYVVLGMEHIATGPDHLAFLLALLLLCRRLRDVAWLVTGFTLGHSLTLALAVLGVVRPDMPVVEALIGFTIALVAAENVTVRTKKGRLTVAAMAASILLLLAAARLAFDVGLPVRTCVGLAIFAFAYLPLAANEEEARRTRPLISLLFGLVHGFGFASVLLEVGLPAGRLASALFGFNLGVELGQLAIVGLLWFVGRTLAARLTDPRASRLVVDALSALLCGLGLFWFVQRALAV